MTEPRRVLIDWDYGAHGIWWVLGTAGWEVLYQMDGQMLRVHPPGSWPIDSWSQQLLGYAPRRQEPPDG